MYLFCTDPPRPPKFASLQNPKTRMIDKKATNGRKVGVSEGCVCRTSVIGQIHRETRRLEQTQDPRSSVLRSTNVSRGPGEHR